MDGPFHFISKFNMADRPKMLCDCLKKGWIEHKIMFLESKKQMCLISKGLVVEGINLWNLFMPRYS